MDPMGKKGFQVPTNKKCFPNHPRTSSKNKNPPYSPEHLTYPEKKKKNNLVGRCFQKNPVGKWSLLWGKKSFIFRSKSKALAPLQCISLSSSCSLETWENRWMMGGHLGRCVSFPVRIQVFLLRNEFIPRIHLNRRGMFRPTILM